MTVVFRDLLAIVAPLDINPRPAPTGTGAIASGLPSPLPCLKISPAAATGASVAAVGMEACVLVQWHRIWGVGRAEDVATAATVVPSVQEGEGSVAAVGVAGRGRRVGL